MLAQTFRSRLPKGPLYSQPKLDGIRCLATADGLWSRTGGRIASCQHIEAALRHVFYRDPTLVLDGELYNHELRRELQLIISLVNTRNPGAAKSVQVRELIQFHIFDLASHECVYSERLAHLNTKVAPLVTSLQPIRFVKTSAVGSQADADQLYSDYLAQGFEGQMIRADAPYVHGRTANLMKRKPFQDAEFDIVRIDEVGGTHSGYAKRVVLRLPDGRTFGAGIKCSRDFARELLHRNPLTATVRFFGRTPAGIPRNPIAVAIHDGPRL